MRFNIFFKLNKIKITNCCYKISQRFKSSKNNWQEEHKIVLRF